MQLRPLRLAALAVALAAALVTLSALLPGCGKSRQAPVVVIGLDGADWDLLVPWMEAGELPNLKAFLETAEIGGLTTVHPILSPVCWTSGYTGCNPGKTGIFDFQKIDPASGELLIETATHRRAQPIWMLLSDVGKRVAVMNVPMTYPPDPVRGEMISGFPFPSGDVNITYPPELHAKLKDYPLDYLGLNMFGRTPETLFADFMKGEEARRRVALDWLGTGNYDFCWLVFTGTDKVQHFFWKYMDKNHPGYTPEGGAKFGNAILDLWRLEDKTFGEMMALLPKDATVLIMSDHGFDAIYRQVNMANWLPETDLPAWLTTHAIPSMMITNGLLHYTLDGTLSGSSDREAFIDKFQVMCKELKDPQTGLCPFEHVYRREDIYTGRMMEKAPDVIFDETAKYFVTRGVPDSVGVPVIQDVWTTSFSAYHRPEGIIAVRGPQMKHGGGGTLRERLARGGDFKGARILDVMPTLLAIMRQPIPDDVDGRVLTEAMDPDFLAAHPPSVEPVEGFLLDRPPPSTLTDQEREALKAIPYIQ